MWRKAFSNEYKKMKEVYKPDFTIVNIENITSWRGPASLHAEYIENFWVDLMTLWDHSFDNAPNILEYFSKENGKIIRPANFPESSEYLVPGVGYQILIKKWKRLLVIQLLWEVFMWHKVDNPFIKVSELLEKIPNDSYDSFVVEFHRETTAELYGMANYLDGKAGLVYGTHTHIQTNDAHILSWGTAMITDVWMNWPFDWVIGADFNSVKKRFLTGIQRGKIEQKLTWKYVVNAIVVDLDEASWLATHIENISFTSENK